MTIGSFSKRVLPRRIHKALAILKNGAPPDFSPSMIAPSIISTRDDEPQGTNGDGLTGHHTGETDQQDDQAPPDPDLGVLLYERLWQLVIRSGLWHLDSISFNEGLAIRGWLVRPQNWFGEETFTVNGLPFTSVEMGDKRPDVVRRLMVDESRVRGFRCWIDLDDVPNRSEGFLLSNVDKRTLAPLVPSHCKYFSEAHTPIPEPKLRIRVHGSEDEGSFIRYGAHIYGNLVHTLDRALGKTFDDFRSVMDWGCGCGRVLRNVATRHKVNLTGVDIDSEAIGWCEEAFPDCSFHAIRRDPPLPLASESIDLTYGISVLTHLSERDQFKWLEELRRVTRPGGVVLLTVHGDHAWFRVEKSCTAYLDWKRHGFRDAYRDSAIDGVIDDPNYYRDVYHDGSYIVREWSKYFRVVEILPGMVLDYQDLVVLVRE